MRHSAHRRDDAGGERAPEADPSPAPVDAELDELMAGLAEPQKRVSSKYFYDAVGSSLFQRITELPEYYPTRTEAALLQRVALVWMAEHAPASLAELGAGSAEKSRILIRSMLAAGTGRHFLAADVSGTFLERSARALREEFPELVVHTAVGDMTREIPSLHSLPAPRWLILLGSTIGNFDDDAARALLRRARGRLEPGDAFLLGVDLRPGPTKSLDELEAAYNDAEGVTAAFNRNILTVLNRRFGCDFDPEQFEHLAFYDEASHRIEMHLVSRIPQVVRVPGREEVRFAAGETLRTEISCKYDRPGVEAMAADAGLRLRRWEEEDGRFALALLTPG